MRKLFAMALVCLASLAHATVAISGNLQSLGAVNVTSKTYVRFELKNCGGNIPLVSGVAALVPGYLDFTPVAGAISGTLYGNDVISCSGFTNTFYDVTFYYGGVPLWRKSYNITGSSWNLNTAIPIVPSPTGALYKYIVANPTLSQVITQPAATSFTVVGGNGFDIGASTLTGLLQRANGGLGNATFGLNSAIYFDGTKFVSSVPAGGGTLAWCKTNDGVPFWGNCTIVGTGTPLISNTANPAPSGAIRLAPGDAMNFMKTDLSGAMNGISKNAGNQVVVGDTAGMTTTSLNAASSTLTGALAANSATLTTSLTANAVNSVTGTFTGLLNANSLASSTTATVNQMFLNGVAGNGIISMPTDSIDPSCLNTALNFCYALTFRSASSTSGGIPAGGLAFLAGQPLGSSQHGGNILLEPSFGVDGLPDGNVILDNGVAADSTGYKHKRFGASCATGAVAGNSCTTTYSWVTAYRDANYTPVCWE
jgi:hypothetical protein